MSPVQQIGRIHHPVHGTYYLYWDRDSALYGISRDADDLTTHCGYASLAALLTWKGL
jgi:hypothetical protein